MTSSFCSQVAGGVHLFVQVSPQSSKNQIQEVVEGTPERLKIKLAAPPVDGEANEELIRFLAHLLKLPKSSFQLLNGQTQKRKKLLVVDVTKEFVMNALLPHIA